MTDDSAQLEMLGKRGVSVSVELQDEVTRGCRDRHHALVKCYEVSNLSAKQVYGPLGIDQGVFSRILGGTAYLAHNLKFQWMQVCGNDIPLRYDALCRGYELRPIQTDAEAKLAEAERRIAELEQKLKWTVELAVGRRA